MMWKIYLDTSLDIYDINGKLIKGIVHFEAYLKGIQDVGVFVSTVFSILIFFGQTVVVYRSYNGGLGSSLGSPQKTYIYESLNHV